jgi:hypothetical protein
VSAIHDDHGYRYLRQTLAQQIAESTARRTFRSCPWIAGAIAICVCGRWITNPSPRMRPRELSALFIAFGDMMFTWIWKTFP